MFEVKRRVYFIVAIVCVVCGLSLMVIDPAEYGFGVLTLCIAPPLLLAGFFLPFPAMGDVIFSTSLLSAYRRNPMLHLAGVFTFFCALITYFLTLEPTASLWDCSEFIASAYKLQVPHTPGTPLALLIGRVFTMVSFGDVFKVAWSLNLMSGFFSALTVWMVFHLVALFAQKLIPVEVKHRNRLVCVAAFCAGMCLAFSDSFWFTAVEAETYGIACFFLMVLVWLIVTGKDLKKPFKSRRLVLIFYFAGLSYCVHPMCLLALPLMPVAWWAHSGRSTKLRLFKMICAGFALVFIVNRFVAIGIFELAFSLDVFFVNRFHFPFYSGAIIFCAIVITTFVLLIRRYKRYHAFLWSAVFLIVGFLPYAMLFIRSNKNPAIDETNPENLPLIKAYMNRESYPSRPLLYGPYFDARIHDVSVKKKMYYKGKDSYEVAGTLPEYHFDQRQTLLPRIYSNDPAHIETYRAWTNVREGESPTFIDNLEFMFRYQLGHMYLRYLMWNFAGRAGDEQGSPWLAPWQGMSGSAFERSHNQYWMFPLLLGLMGAAFQYKRDRKGFVANAMLFLITGLVLALYLNSTPNEPRERDYIYVGSYIAFSVWIGIGVVAVSALLWRWRSGRVIIALVATAVPAWMCYQNFDDHDRSERTLQIDHAKLVLNSCAPGSILFTGGDNDTFPLWYLQEVEGFRTDVRVMVLSYMNTDWYINQLRRRYYESQPFRLSLTADDYRQYGLNDVLYVQEAVASAIDAAQFLALLKEGHPGLRKTARNGESYHVMPSRKLRIHTSANRAASGSQSSDIVVEVSRDHVSKNALAILDLMVSNGWSRPIYFNFSSLNSLDIDFTPYSVQEGVLFRLDDRRHSDAGIAINTSESYRHLIEQADYSNLADPSIYFSYEDHFARIVVPLRHSFNDLAEAFLRQGDRAMATKVIRYALEKLYHPHLRASYTNLQAAEICLALDEKSSALILAKDLFEYQYQRRHSENDAWSDRSSLEHFLLRRSAELLAAQGEEAYLKRLANMDVAGLVK